MKELFDALAKNEFAKNQNVTLEYVITNTWQDSQYSRAAAENGAILDKYRRYEHMTIRELKEKFSN
jgi:hypothetical protein